MTVPMRRIYKMSGGSWKLVAGADVEVVIPPEPLPTVPPTVFATGNFYAATAAVTPQWPAGHQTNDIGVMTVQTSNQALGSIPTGWAYAGTLPLGVGTAGAAGSTMLHVLWKRATSSAETAFSVGDSGDHQVARITVLRGCRVSGSPIDVSSFSTLGTASTAVSIASITTTVDNALVVGWVANGVDVSTPQAPTVSASWGWNALTQFGIVGGVQTGQGFGGGAQLFSGVMLSHGATGTVSTTLTTSSLQVRGMIAFAPEPGAGTTPGPVTGYKTYMGVSELVETLFGTYVMPDALIGDANATNWITTTTGHIDKARNAPSPGTVLIARVTPGNANFKNPPVGVSRVGPDGQTYTNIGGDTKEGDFRPDIWIDYWNHFVAVLGTSGMTKWQLAVHDGIIRWLQILDDIAGNVGDNAFTHTPTFEQVEQCAAAVKADMPWMATGVRASLESCRAKALQNGVVRKYVYLDLGVATYVANRANNHPASTWIAGEVQKGKDCGLATAGAVNLARGSGDAPWGCQQVTGTFCGDSPDELDEGMRAMLARTDVVGINIWSYEFGGSTYMAKSAISAKLLEMYNLSVGRDDPFPNIRGDLPAAP